MGKLIVVAGAQFGSEGKGAVADHLTRPSNNVNTDVIAVRVAGPNAGHTVYGECPPDCGEGPDHVFNGVQIGHPWRLRSVPVSAVNNPEADLIIAAGSEIDLEVLAGEVSELDSAGYRVTSRLHIDEQATILGRHHIQAEVEDKIQERLGSTAKGIGAARADRIWRKAELARDAWGMASFLRKDTADMMYRALELGATVMIEGTQGYGLGLHAGHYPQCTSSDARAIDFLAMAGLSPWHHSITEFEVWLAARVRPIRVAGNSGAMKGETSWGALGLPEEFTTVTKKVRRVGEWDGELVKAAVRANGGAPTVKVALTMADTVFPELAAANDLDDIEAETWSNLIEWLTTLEDEIGAPIRFIGTSPVNGFWRS
jgi:adenylosuccinate synthase